MLLAAGWPMEEAAVGDARTGNAGPDWRDKQRI